MSKKVAKIDPSNEEQYVRLIARGDAAAFQAIYLHYSPRIYNKLLKVLKSEDLAADLLQDIFSILWQKREQIDPSKSFGAFLFKIGDNLVIDLFRRAKRDKILLQQLLDASVQNWEPTEQMLRKEKEQWLEQSMSAMPAQRQRVFRLCKIEKKTHEEVAQLLGISPATVNNHLVKAIQFLKERATNDPGLTGILLLSWLFS